MYGMMGSLGPMWEALSQWTSLSNLLGAAVLLFFLTVHVVAVSLVVRAVDGTDRMAATQRHGVHHPVRGYHEVSRSSATASRPSANSTGFFGPGSAARRLRHHA
jgi:hypothetical protein